MRWLLLIMTVLAQNCPSTCKLPDCKCASKDPPVSNPPQFITITFDDAIHDGVYSLATGIFAHRKNPNGCPVKATYFAQALYSNPAVVAKWYADGNEIADHSFAHTTPFAGSYAELEGMRAWFNAYAGIPRGKIRGVRFPFRKYTKESIELVGKMGFEYESSMAALGDDKIWPYTLDHGVHTECNGADSLCKDDVKVPGLWEIPMYGTLDSNGFHLMDPFNDPSIDKPMSPEDVTNLYNNELESHYNGNRAPFGVYVHPVWFSTGTPGIPDGSAKMAAVNEFLDEAQKKNDVWIVTEYQLIQYMRNPVPASQLAAQDYMRCAPTPPNDICNGRGVVGLENCGFTNSFSTCFGCPEKEPTLNDPLPKRVTSRCPVPEDCDSIYWDPVGCSCKCNQPSCEWEDISRGINLDPKSVDEGNNGGGEKPRNNGSEIITTFNLLLAASDNLRFCMSRLFAFLTPSEMLSQTDYCSGPTPPTDEGLWKNNYKKTDIFFTSAAAPEPARVINYRNRSSVFGGEPISDTPKPHSNYPRSNVSQSQELAQPMKFGEYEPSADYSEHPESPHEMVAEYEQAPEVEMDLSYQRAQNSRSSIFSGDQQPIPRSNRRYYGHRQDNDIFNRSNPDPVVQQPVESEITLMRQPEKQWVPSLKQSGQSTSFSNLFGSWPEIDKGNLRAEGKRGKEMILTQQEKVANTFGIPSGFLQEKRRGKGGRRDSHASQIWF